jgi:hypothetical protein
VDQITEEEPIEPGEGTPPTPSKKPGDGPTGAALSVRDAAEARLEELVAEGVMVKFTNRDGLPMYGFPLNPEHEHGWGAPKLKDWWITDEGETMIETTWYCIEPGCRERLVIETAVEL